MKQLLFTLLFIGFFNSNTQAQYNWQALPNAPRSHRFDDIYFLTPNKGWAIHAYYNYLTPNQYGEVFTTNDGGLTWQMLFDSSKTFIRCVGFTDNLNGWFGNIADSTVTADKNFMYHTADGGSSWSPVTNVTGPKPKGICGISIVNDSVVYAYGRYYGPAVLMKTTNKGQTWISQNLGSLASGLVDARFFTADTGFVVGSSDSTHKATILSTYDGGATWQVRYKSNMDNETCWKISFPSRKIGYASIESHVFNFSVLAPDTTYFLKTIDGGITWQRKIFKTNGYYDLEGIGFINDSIGWIGGDCCQTSTYKTIDGGEHWSADATFGIQAPPYNSIYHGYAINRFRRFGDTLMYASGNTIYKLKKGTTGINAIDLPCSLVSIFPNPIAQYVEITLNSSELIGTPRLTLYNMLGQVVLKEKPIYVGISTTLDLKELMKGLYIYQIKTDQKIISTGKLIKE